MAKKKNPWLIEPEVAKKEATKSVKKEVAKSVKKVKKEVAPKSEERKMMKLYPETHKRLKYLALDADMQMIDYLDQIVGEKWEKRNK